MNGTQPDIIEPEVLPRMDGQKPNTVCWDLQSTLRSPVFWFLLGMVTAGVAIHQFQKKGGGK